MNCKDFKEKMLDYPSDDNANQELKEHLAHCPACNAEFEHLQRIVQTLKPKIKIKASDNFTHNTIKKISKEDQRMKKRVPFYLKVAAVILLLITPLSILLLNTDFTSQASASPVNRIFTESLKTLSKSKSMQMELEIRALEGDNFDYIGKDFDFVKHQIKVEFSPRKWMIEKPGRTVMFDGKNQYLDIQNIDCVLKGGVDAGFVEWLHILLSPDKILEAEKQRAKKEEANYTIEETENQLILTSFASAKGDYTNDYLKNTSVTSSDNKRIFCFDKESHQLRSFELYIIDNQEEILMMKTTDIKYDETFDPQDFSVKKFGNKEIKDIKQLEPKADKELINKTPKEVAFYFFNACAKNDWKSAKKVAPFPYHPFLKPYFSDLEIIEIGEAFQSGTYPGYFVPYTVKLKSGDIKQNNLGLRNDNSEGMWQIDGGL